MGNGVTGFLGTLDMAVKDVIAKYTLPGNLDADDIVILNTPYEGGGSHLSDISLVMPVFDGGSIVGYVVNKAHWSEVGGMDPGSVTTNSTDIYQEGLHFPCVKLCEGGRMNEALVEMIRANVRLPDMSIGDMWAGISALRMGERRLQTLIGKYGRETVLTAMARLLDYGETMARGAIAKLAKGTFSSTDFLDADGLGNGPFEVKCAVTITDDEFICDFTGSHPQVPGSINCTYVNLASRSRAVYRAVTVPNVATNGGMYRPLKVICPPGTLFTALSPAPTSTYYESAIMALDIIWKALRTFRNACRPAISPPPPPSGCQAAIPKRGNFGTSSAPSSAAGGRRSITMADAASSAPPMDRLSTFPSKSPKLATASRSSATPFTPSPEDTGSFAAATGSISTTGRATTISCWPPESDATSTRPGGSLAAPTARAATSK